VGGSEDREDFKLMNYIILIINLMCINLGVIDARYTKFSEVTGRAQWCWCLQAEISIFLKSVQVQISNDFIVLVHMSGYLMLKLFLRWNLGIPFQLFKLTSNLLDRLIDILIVRIPQSPPHAYIECFSNPMSNRD